MIDLNSPTSPLDLLFVDIPFDTYEYGRRFRAARSYKKLLSPHELHLGFRYMVSALRSQGYAAEIIFPAKENGFTSQADILQAISRIQPLILGFSSYEGSLRESLNFIKKVKAKGSKSLVCFGGHLATFSYQELLRDFHDLVDVVVLGEGEHTIVDLVKAIKTKKSFRQIPGIAYYDGSKTVTTTKRPVEQNINLLPFPLIEITEKWKNSSIPLFVTTSRGCYGQCSFCRTSHFGEKWRARDPKNIVDEIEHAYRQDVSIFELVDDNFMGPGSLGQTRARAVAAEIKRRGLKIRYHISCRVNDVEECTMQSLKDSGLISVSLGIESGVQRILDTFNKNITVSQSITALQILQRLQIPTRVYIIFFDPYMTLAEAKENLHFLQYIRSFDNVRFENIIFRKLIPVSGTAIFEKLLADGMLRGNYLTGHYFVFKDSGVALLSNFMETIDSRCEKLFLKDEFKKIDGLYESFKTVFEFAVMEKAIELLEADRWKKSEAQIQLDNLLSKELRALFNPGFGRMTKTKTTTKGGRYHE